MITLQMDIIRCTKLATNVSDQNILAWLFVMQKHIITCVAEWLCYVTAILLHSCLSSFSLMKGCVMLFWPKTDALSFVHLMSFICKNIISYYGDVNRIPFFCALYKLDGWALVSLLLYLTLLYHGIAPLLFSRNGIGSCVMLWCIKISLSADFIWSLNLKFFVIISHAVVW